MAWSRPVSAPALGALKVYTEEEYAKVHTERSLRKIAEKLV